LSIQLLFSSHYMETIVLHSPTFFLNLIAWVLIISPSSKVKRRGGGNPNLKEGGGDSQPLDAVQCFSFYTSYHLTFFFCMPAIHRGNALLKTKLHLVYVLLLV
jgi:hypothetical protein